MAFNFIKVSGIIEESITDGPGIRYVLFVQGCPHRCEGCHNPQTFDFDAGSKMSTEEIFDGIKKNPLLSGVTFSGGEPFCQAKELVPLVKLIKGLSLEIAVYTGYTYEEILDSNDKDKFELLSLADILIDGKFLIEQKSLLTKFKGSKNQRILNVKKSLEAKAAFLEESDRWV